MKINQIGTEGKSASTKMLEADLVAGVVLGDRYELLTPVAKGGMGRVWVARAKGGRGFKRLLAVKTLLTADYEESRLEDMLFQEAKLASMIHHPNVVAVEDFGEHRGVCYLAMELVRGETFLGLIKAAQASGGIPLKLAVNLIGQVCRGLHAAHELVDEDEQPLGLIHRDVTPGNIIVTYDGNAKLLDFGIAKASTSAALTEVGEIKGKMAYMAPEMLMQTPIDRRVDLFAVGIMLYLATTGVHPFRGGRDDKGGSNDVIARIVSDKAPMAPSDLTDFYPEALEKVVMKALEKDRDRRYSSAAELLEDLTKAVPEAFSPSIEREIQEYLEDLLSERISETNAQLRAAEELAERSFPDVSKVQAVLPVVSKPPDPMREITKVLFMVLGILLVPTGILAAVVGFSRPPKEVPESTSEAPSASLVAPPPSAVPPPLPAPSASVVPAVSASSAVVPTPKPVKRTVNPDNDLWITPAKPRSKPTLTPLPADGLLSLDPWAEELSEHTKRRTGKPLKQDL